MPGAVALTPEQPIDIQAVALSVIALPHSLWPQKLMQQSLLEHIRSGEPSTLTIPSDLAAVGRLKEVLANPQKKLNDINNHLSTVFRGLYRNRNIVLHGGKTDAVGLRSSLRNAAPLVGAGMDRIAHAWFVEGTEPVQVAARAGVRLATAGAPDGPGLVDLLAPA